MHIADNNNENIFMSVKELKNCVSKYLQMQYNSFYITYRRTAYDLS